MSRLVVEVMSALLSAFTLPALVNWAPDASLRFTEAVSTASIFGAVAGAAAYFGYKRTDWKHPVAVSTGAVILWLAVGSALYFHMNDVWRNTPGKTTPALREETARWLFALTLVASTGITAGFMALTGWFTALAATHKRS